MSSLSNFFRASEGVSSDWSFRRILWSLEDSLIDSSLVCASRSLCIGKFRETANFVY